LIFRPPLQPDHLGRGNPTGLHHRNRAAASLLAARGEIPAPGLPGHHCLHRPGRTAALHKGFILTIRSEKKAS
jgi:hypothetical protein